VRGACRFTPTCSDYSVLAIERYGLVDGGRRALARFARCRPPYGGRDDP
jgi:putative component of membrane protein insertase Oxa1/YidC/SpoIIIJ protein YidD